MQKDLHLISRQRFSPREYNFMQYPPNGNRFRHLGEGVRFFGDVRVGDACIVEDYCIVGKPDMYTLSRARNDLDIDIEPVSATTLGDRVILGASTKIYSGSFIGSEVETEDDVRIGWNATIGPRTRLMFRAQVYCGVQIGSDCRISGFVGDNVILGDRIASFGSLVHDYPHRTSTYEYRPSPIVRADVIIGFGAVVVGSVTIGASSYVAANAVVTRDVPEDHICFGYNQLIPKSRWPGKLGRFVD